MVGNATEGLDVVVDIFVCKQESQCMNVLLRLLQEDVISLKACLLSDWEMIPRHLQPVADSLINETVPERWRRLQPELSHQSVAKWLKGNAADVQCC